MDTKHENLSNNESNEELDPKIQALADMAGKMGELGRKPDEYNEFGFDGNGVHKNGTRFDEEGYGADGFNQKGYNRAGYDREGLDRNGFNKKGIHNFTNTRYDVNGYNKDGYNRDGFDRGGHDRDGYNTQGYDRNGFDKDGFSAGGFNREGINKYTNTKFNPSGWNQFYTIHEDTETRYDPKGYDANGYDKDGYYRDGFNGEGYDREGLDKDGYTREYNAKFNEFGVDENGYMKNGEIDPDVEFAISFSESGIKELTKYAAEKGMEYKEVQGKIESARKKFPAIDETITNILLTGNKMRAAAISNDCEKFINGELDVKEFWDKHPRLNISGVLFNFINDPEKRKQFSDRTVENLVLDSDSVEENLRIFGTSRYDVPGALKGIEDFKKTYVRFGVDGSPEQIQKKRENTKKIFDTMKYLSKYKNQNLNSLLGSRQSFDGGQTWPEFNGEVIGQAMDALKADKKLICVQSVKDYIVKQIKNSSQNKTQ